jgi:hypothetical protein
MAGMTDSAPQHVGAKVIDSRGHAVGKVSNVFYDDRTLEAKWVAVNLGLLHRSTPLVPLKEAYFSDSGHLVVPFTEDTITPAPPAQDAAPTTSEAAVVARHYGISMS